MRAMVYTRHCKKRPPGGGHSCCYYLLAFCFTVILPCTQGASLPYVGKRLRGAAELPLSMESLLGSSGSRHLLQASATVTETMPRVIAEGGAQYLYPEMTMRAYEAAMESGADFVTCMIAITRDGKAFCHPDLELTASTNIREHPNFMTREFKFNQRVGVYSFNFTLDEIKTLKVRQTKPEGRIKAFDDAFPVSTPEELIEAINARAAQYPLAKRVGLALEISNATGEMERLEIGPSPVTYAIALLKSKGWTLTSSPAMVIAKLRTQLNAFVKEGVLVQRLLRFLPTGMGKTQIGEDLSGNVSEAFSATAKDASGVLLHISSALTDTSENFWGQTIPKVAWTNSTVGVAKKQNLTIFIWGFVEENWSSAGKNFNTFLFDQLGMYRSLFYGQIGPLVNGVATDWPATAATAAACYQKPVRPQAAKDRPLVISSGGSVGLLPPHTNLSYLQAIKEGADYIDCILQVSKDGVLFCLESMQLSKYTDVNENAALKNRSKTYKFSDDGPPDWWSFDFTWAEIQTLRVLPKTKNNNAIQDSKRPDKFFGTLPPLSFDNFISIAGNASRPVGIYIKIDNPTFISGLGRSKPDHPVDQIEILMATLRRRGYLSSTNAYNAAVNPPLLISSYDSCGLVRMNSISHGTLNLVQRTDRADPCEVITKNERNQTSWWTSIPGLQVIRTYAGAISPGKKSILKINNGSTNTPYDGVIPMDGVYPIVGNAQSQGMKVYPRAFGNDVAPGDGDKAYDFLSDPTLELQYYFDQLNVNGLESQFVATAVGFLESSCRPHPGLTPTDPGFNITEVRPGALAKEIFGIQPKVEPADKGNKVEIEVIVGVACAAFVLAMALAALLFFLYRRRKATLADKVFRDDLGSLANLPMLKVFTQGDLVAATNNFSESSRLGKGGFGTVYKAILPDGTVVAVKKLHYEVKTSESVRSDVSIKQLMNEVEIIGTVHNRNVVPLQGVCMDKELLLVYDYMPNGSLQEAIFDPEYPIKLDWRQWYNIALGTAKGLAYLHEECEHKIIHRDIKPANILLDNSLNARVADFGLARNVQVDETHVTTKVMGSIGYMAPDYATTGQLTERSDTYSFGILLLTMITGRRPILPEGGDTEESVTLEWVRRKAQEGPAELLTVINPKLEGMYDPDEAIRWLYTALLCAQNDPASRPSMGDVVQMLSGNRPVPQICVMPAAVIFPDYQRSYHSQENSSRYSLSGLSQSSQDFHNSGIFDTHHLDNSIIREGR